MGEPAKARPGPRLGAEEGRAFSPWGEHGGGARARSGLDDEDEVEVTQRAAGRKYPAQRRRGYSKNGRGDAPQIVVGMAVTR